MQNLLRDYELMIQRAERNARLFHGPHWDAHLETLREDELPDLLSKQEMIEYNLEVFKNEVDEVERLDTAREMVKREIAHLRERTHKKKGRKK